MLFFPRPFNTLKESLLYSDLSKLHCFLRLDCLSTAHSSMSGSTGNRVNSWLGYVLPGGNTDDCILCLDGLVIVVLCNLLFYQLVYCN